MSGSFKYPLALGAMFIAVTCSAQDDRSELEARPVVDMIFPVAPMINFANTHVTPGMGNNAGIVSGFAIYPFKERPMALEVRARFGRYGRSVAEVAVDTQEDGIVDVEIVHFSRMHQLMFGLKFIDARSPAFIKPFFTPQAGWAFMRSRLMIPDPSDDCEALESKLIHAGNGMVYGGEAGLEFSLVSKAVRRSGRAFERDNASIFVAVSMTRSFREVEYINVRNMMDEVPANAHHTVHHGDHHSDVLASFVNIRSNEVHHHKVAEIYRAPLSFIGVSAGLLFRF